MDDSRLDLGCLQGLSGAIKFQRGGGALRLCGDESGEKWAPVELWNGLTPGSVGQREAI